MLNARSLSGFKFSLFDQLVILILLGLALLAGLLLWVGDRVGVQVIQVSPSDGATGISTKSTLQVTFDQAIDISGSDLPLTVSPPVSGTVRWQENTLIYAPAQALAPETTYTVNLAENLESQRGRPLRGMVSWQFQTRQPRILYIAPDEENRDQIFVIDPAGGEPAQLTDQPFGVFDYALSPDGSTLVYGALREDGGSDLWTIASDGSNRAPLLTCPEAVCNGAIWTADGQRLIYERRNMLVPGAAPGPPRLWWLNLADGETVPVFEDKQIIGYGAAWSPDGDWLSYVAPNSQGVQILDVAEGDSVLIPSRMGGLAEWSPDGESLLVTDIQPTDNGFAVHLLRAGPESGELTDLSGETEPVEDSSPTWSPDGEWIAFTRKQAGAAMGKQLWLMRADGSQARPLTHNPEIHHGLPAWSPAGRYLVYQRFPLKELGARPGIWLLDLETEQAKELASGNRPRWLP